MAELVILSLQCCQAPPTPFGCPPPLGSCELPPWATPFAHSFTFHPRPLAVSSYKIQKTCWAGPQALGHWGLVHTGGWMCISDCCPALTAFLHPWFPPSTPKPYTPRSWLNREPSPPAKRERAPERGADPAQNKHHFDCCLIFLSAQNTRSLPLGGCKSINRAARSSQPPPTSLAPTPGPSGAASVRKLLARMTEPVRECMWSRVISGGWGLELVSSFLLCTVVTIIIYR